MQSGFSQAKVLLTGKQKERFLRKMQNDPAFSKKCLELIRAGNDDRVAQFLKKNGFKLV